MGEEIEKQNKLDKGFERLANQKTISGEEAQMVICRLMSNATHGSYDDDTLFMRSEIYNYEITIKEILK